MMRNLIKNILREDDFDWIRDIRMSLQPDSVYYFLPPLNNEEARKLENKIEDNGYIQFCLGYGTRTGDGNNDLLFLSTNEHGVVDAWQNSVNKGGEYHTEGIFTLDHIVEVMDDSFSDDTFYTYVDGRDFFFNKNIIDA